MAQNDKKVCLTSYTWNCTSYDCDFWYTCIKWWYLQQIFSCFQKSDFCGFSKFMNKCQKEILRCAPPFSHVCDFFAKLWLLSQLELSMTELPKCTQIVPQWKIVTITFVLFYQFFFFEKIIFELEAYDSFKITCILVKQVISLKKNGGLIWWWKNLLLNFIVSYLCSFNPCISISENGRYLSHSNI